MNNMNDLSPLKKPIYNCFIGALCIFAEWYSGKYEYLLASCWYYEFNYPVAGTTGWTTESFNETEVKGLLRLGGRADYTWHEKPDCSIGFSVIREQLSQNKPVGFVFDAYFCPWSTVFCQEHVYHFLLVTGINSEGYLRCVDNISDIAMELSPDYFINGYNRYITFNYLNSDPSHNQTVNMDEIKDVLLYLTSPTFKESRAANFEDMRRLAVFLESIDVQQELLSYSVLEGAPLLRMFRFFEGGRLHFSEFMLWIYQATCWKWCQSFADEMLGISKEWESAKGMLIKATYVENPLRYFDRISKKIIEIADQEEELFRKFCRQIKATNYL